MLEGYPVIHHGACIVKLTQLPPSKHVLMLSTPLISKNKKINPKLAMSSNIIRGVFLSIKNKYKPKMFSDYFYFGLTGIVCFH
jgi:hypothetical protein